MIPSVEQIKASLPKITSKSRRRPGTPTDTMVARRWQKIFKGISELFERGAVSEINEQKKIIVIKLDRFKAEFNYENYPLFISDWLLKKARKYEDLL